MAESQSSGRFWWLWHNGFYETTGLTGYSFINSSKTKAEALLWYAIIILLGTFTINNVTNLVNYYQSKPTKNEVRIASNASDATIGNFTFKLKLPIAEMHSATPLISWDKNGGGVPLSCEKHLLRNIETAHRHSSECLPLHIIPLIESHNLNDWTLLNPGSKECATPTDTFNLSYAGIVETEKVIQNLHDRFSNALHGIWKGMATTDGGYMNNLHSARDDFNDLMKGTVDRDFFTPFLLLKSMSDATIHNDLPFIKHFNATQYFEHSALSTKEMLQEISSRLLDIAPFVLPDSLSDTKVFIRDWNVDFSDQTLDVVPNHNGEKSIYRKLGNSFTVEFQVRPPEGRQEFTVDINPPKQLIKFLFLFMHMDAFLHDLFSVLNAFVYQMIACDDMTHFDREMTAPERDWLIRYFTVDPRSEFLETFVYPAVNFYKLHSELKLDAGFGDVTLKPFHRYHINQLPMGRMISQTNDCISTTFGECVDLCQAKFTIETCQCYPWNLHYLHTQSGIAICSQPCPGLTEQKDLCLSNCEHLAAHPCDRIMYRPEITNQALTTLEGKAMRNLHLGKGKSFLDEFELFSLKITIEKVMTYVKTLESYEMTFTNLISELGGLVDFWLGVNVIGIIHAFVYFLKQCCHCNREHKTGRTMRQLVSLSRTNNNEVRPMEEESGAGVSPNVLVTIQEQMNRHFREMNEMNRKSEEKIMMEINNINKRIKLIEDRREKY